MAPTSSAISAYSDLNRFSREDNDMGGHTKSPLSGKTVKVCFVEFEKLGITVSIPKYADAEAKANSRRMIACFEALEGLTTEQIEDGVFQKMREHRDFLSAEVDALTKQRNELLSQRNSTGVAIDNAMHGMLPDEHPLLSRLQMISAISAHREHNAQLLEQINNASYSQCLSAADMLHDIKKIASRAIED